MAALVLWSVLGLSVAMFLGCVAACIGALFEYLGEKPWR